MTAQLTSLKVVCQLFTPHLILPDSGCSESTAYAKERKNIEDTSKTLNVNVRLVSAELAAGQSRLISDSEC